MQTPYGWGVAIVLSNHPVLVCRCKILVDAQKYNYGEIVHTCKKSHLKVPDGLTSQ